MIPKPYEKHNTKSPSVKSRKLKFSAWLCSTTFIVSPILADAFNFNLEEDAQGKVLHIERFDNVYVRSNSPDGTPNKGSYRLNELLEKGKFQQGELQVELEEVVINNEKKIRIKLFKGRESLGSLNINDDGTVHVSTQATSDHLFITSTKDIYLDGHTAKGIHDCNLTLNTQANIYLDGIIAIQNLHVIANQIISRDSTQLDAKNIQFKAKSLTTSGEYECASADIDVKNDWDNNAKFKVTDSLSIIRTHTLRNHRTLEARRFRVQKLSHLDNSNVKDDQSQLKIYETVSWAGLTSFQNKGNVAFLQGVDIQASELITTGRMTVFAGKVKLGAHTINIGKLATDEKGDEVELIADYLTSKQLLALSRTVVINVKEKANLNGIHSARSFSFSGGEVEHTGHLEAADKIEFSNLQNFKHSSGEVKAFEINGTVNHFENNGLINAATHLSINGTEFNNSRVVHSSDITLNFANVNNTGDILATHHNIKDNDIKAKLGSALQRTDLSELSLGKISIRNKLGDRHNRLNNKGRIIAGNMTLLGSSFTNQANGKLLVLDKMRAETARLFNSAGFFDVGHLEVVDVTIEGWPPITDVLTVNGNIRTHVLSVEINRDLSLSGKLAVLDDSKATIKAASVIFGGELVWVGILKVVANNTAEINESSQF